MTGRFSDLTGKFPDTEKRPLVGLGDPTTPLKIRTTLSVASNSISPNPTSAKLPGSGTGRPGGGIKVSRAMMKKLALGTRLVPADLGRS